MPQKLPLDTLIELAQGRTDQAARRLGELQQGEARAQEQLGLLVKYREEYLQRLHSRMQDGLSATSLRDYQQFLQTLEGAIEQQRRLASQAGTRLAQGRTDWQDQRRRLGSFETLADRARLQEQAQAQRREQREGDERSAIRFHLRSSAPAN